MLLVFKEPTRENGFESYCCQSVLNLQQEAKRLYADRNIKRRCVPSLTKSHIVWIWGTM